MHREVPLLNSRVRQLARGLIWLAGYSGRLPAILLSFVFVASVSASSVTYTYDELGRLKAAAYDNGSGTTYTLDAAGNRKTVAQSVDTTAPAAPTGLAGTPTTASNIHLTWTACTDAGGIGGYKISKGGSQIGTSTVASYDDPTVVFGSTYVYTVSCSDNAGNTSPQSAPVSVSVVDFVPPSVPTGLTAVAPTSTTVNLAWTASIDTGVSGLAGYRIYRAGTVIGTSATASYSDTTTLGTTTYTYTVLAYDNAANISPQSTGVNVTTPDTIPPSVPTGLIATAISANQINLTWNPSTDTGGSGLAGYLIFRNGGGLAGSATNSYVDTAVGGATTYTYTVRAYDNAFPVNESVQSAPASVTTPANVPGVPGALSPTRKVTTLSWTESWGASAGPIHHYILQRTVDFGAPQNFTINAPTTSMPQSGGNGDSFTFQVQGCNSSNQCSSWSGPIGVTICSGGVCP